MTVSMAALISSDSPRTFKAADETSDNARGQIFAVVVDSDSNALLRYLVIGKEEVLFSTVKIVTR